MEAVGDVTLCVPREGFSLEMQNMHIQEQLNVQC